MDVCILEVHCVSVPLCDFVRGVLVDGIFLSLSTSVSLVRGGRILVLIVLCSEVYST